MRLGLPTEALPGGSRARRTASIMSLSFTLAVVALQPARAADPPKTVLEAQTLRVIDGDTVVFRRTGANGGAADASGGEVRVRLSEIDAPELAQPYGREAGAALRALLGDRTVRLVVVDVDRYGRMVAEVVLDDRSINAEMVRLGHAWAYTRYARTLDIIDREQEAREAKRGLWRLPESEREPPWMWRAEKRRGSGNKTSPTGDVKLGAAEVVCGTKRTCGEMTSCAEARGYLTQCGLSRLDGDSDGTPCESLCAGR